MKVTPHRGEFGAIYDYDGKNLVSRRFFSGLG